MDRISITFVCKHCGYEKEVLFRDMSDCFACRDGDIAMEDNADREKQARNSICPKCKHKGFKRKGR